ncbi:MAG: glycoside hydrolase family 2 TIM barrel-domain containing protein [Pseudomonadales bacterium]
MKPSIKIGLLTALVILMCQACGSSSDAQNPQSEAIKVEITSDQGKYHLLRDGKPYQVKGAGIEYGDIDAFARHGGNSFRTWNIDSGGRTGQQVLDKAQSLGLTVSMNLVLGAEHWGFDYNNKEKVAKQFERIKLEVLKYKDHPALLSWIIGNELNYDFKNPKVYDAVNDISKMIHQLDPNHPTTTTLSGYVPHDIKVILERAADLDYISVQMYSDLVNLPDYIRRDNFPTPLFVTEWGAQGHWEVEKTSWGAPIEKNSSMKAKNYLDGYQQVIEPLAGQVIGTYVFLWGQKQERTATWYGMFTDTDAETETIDVMHYIWNQRWPENRTPKLESMLLNGQSAEDNVKLKANGNYTALVTVKDPENDPIRYRWELRHESKTTQAGGAQEKLPALVTGLIRGESNKEIQIQAPATHGAYRLFVYAYDGNGHAAHANIPFYVDE